MAVKIADTLKALSNTFPVAECVDIDVNINGTTKRLQKAIDDGEIGGGSDSTWKGTHEEWEALSTEEKGKYEVVYFTDDYDESGICGSDSTWKGTRDEWEALLTAEKQKYVIVYFTDDYDAADNTGLIDDTNTSVKTTYSSSKIENSLSKKANTTDLTVHTSDTNIHVTTSDKTKWNKVDNKIDKTNIVDNLTSTNTDKPLSANQGKVLKGEVDLKANSTDLTSHTSNTNTHITTNERTKWNKVDNKIDKTDITTTIDSASTDTQVPSAKSVKTELDKKAGTDKISHVSNYVCSDSPIIDDTMYRLYSGNDNIRFQKFINFGTSNRSIEWDYNLFNKDYGLFYQALGEGKDLNDLHMNCFFTANNKCLNTPDVTKNFFGISLCHAGVNGYSTQICVHANENVNTSKQRTIYVRHCYNGTWGDWGTISTTSVADVGVTTINPTLPSTVTLGSSQRIIYSIKNGWANVSTVMQFASPKLSWAVIATGLPKPDKTVNTSTVGETFVNANVAYRIKTDGTLEMLIATEITQLNWWNINVSYPVAEE